MLMRCMKFPKLVGKKERERDSFFLRLATEHFVTEVLVVIKNFTDSDISLSTEYRGSGSPMERR
jgi:hypothetical protein